jgi:hypothetical protein
LMGAPDLMDMLPTLLLMRDTDLPPACPQGAT